MKVVYSDPKIGKTNQMEITNDVVHYLINKKIGEIIDGSLLGLTGFKLKITGGSDKSAFPMNKSIDSAIKTRILKRSGKEYERKNVRGKIISNEIEQINTVIVEYGSKPASELFKIEEEQEHKEKESRQEKQEPVHEKENKNKEAQKSNDKEINKIKNENQEEKQQQKQEHKEKEDNN